MVHDTRTLVTAVTSSDSTLGEKHDAFHALVLAFQDMAYACGYAVLGDFSLAEDASQQAFITAWQRIDQLREPGAFPGWFRKILLTECSRITRRKRLAISSLEAGEAVASLRDDPQEKVERDEIKAAVFAAIEKLPLNERIVVSLFYLEDHTHDDISAFLGVPVTTVAKRLYSARCRLKGNMMSGFKKNVSRRRPSRNASFAEKVRAGLYDEYVGSYRFQKRPELVIEIKRDGERLISETPEQRHELFAPKRPGGELRTREFDGRGRFIRNRRGRISHFVYYEFGREMGIANKVS